MKILWLTWKDRKHPLAGGAELVNEELAKRAVADGHEVTFLVGGFSGGVSEEIISGYKVVRLGGRFSVYWKAYRYYKEHLKGWADLVIDEVNTVPFLAKFYVVEKNILFTHQLCREIWFYQIFFPINIIGYITEPLYLWLLRDRKVITVSESTKKDLMRFGFKAENIDIISEGIELEPLSNLESVKKFDKPTILSLGVIRPMKRTDHIVRAFEIAKETIPSLELVIAGDANGAFGKKVVEMIKNSMYRDSIRYEGRVSREKKIELLQKSHVLTVTSIKEGWGLIVTEANSQGTPAVIYNVDGLRDAVKNGETGLIAEENTPQGLSRKIVQALQDKSLYDSMRTNAWSWSKEINFNTSHSQFAGLIKNE